MAMYLSQENHVFTYNCPSDGISAEYSVPTNGSSSPVEYSSSSSSEGEGFKEKDHSDAMLKFISQMLMEEEDLGNKPCMLHDCLALQATEKSLFDVLNTNDDETTQDSSSYSRVKKNRYREDTDCSSRDDLRSNKQLADDKFSDETETLEMYDKVLLCSVLELEEVESRDKKPSMKQSSRGNKKKGIPAKETVDHRTLLTQCAQAVASNETRTATELLSQIKRHSSPHGDGTERLAHYFAGALEARLAGTGGTFYSRGISAAEILKAYKTYITACPFRKMSNLYANKTIKKLADGATTLHIIDFGILYGFQWPCLIHALSERPDGPPKLRITGIDFPQPGLRPAARVGDTGRRLAKYCERFRVPFEYNAIAQKWDTIKIEDLKIERNELLVVNSLYRLHNVPDETVMVNSPRDTVLELIKKVNPDLFIHGVVNGTYNTPFFTTRFREALYQYSSLFDMFDATVPREDQNRMRFEEEVLGKDVMNIIACEGTERVDRPETYKQWGVRSARAGFEQVPLDRDILKYVRSKVKKNYHKDFSVDEDGKWMLQGWKGRVVHAISYWKPSHN
ncbi:hypothetical protein ABFX02_04G180300 [Erythranthe guttata]